MGYHQTNQKFFEALSSRTEQRSGRVALALWAFFEANFWFIAPDFLLILFGVSRPGNSFRFAAWALLWSFVGGTIYWIICSSFPDWSWSVLLSTPFVSDRMITFIKGVYKDHGYLGNLFQAFSFMSFKIWTACAVKIDWNPLAYFPLVMVSRFIRLYVVTVISSLIGKLLREQISRHFLPLTVIYAISFILMLIMIET